jgi:hypothetical protein
LEAGVSLNWTELSTYPTWALARISNKEDPRNLVAFAEHVRLVGGDYKDLLRYGVPSVLASTEPEPWTPTDLRGKLPIREGRSYFERDLAGITGVTIHYTASPVESGTQAVRDIAAYQVGPTAQEPFPGIAYSLIVDGAGIAYLCWNLNIRVWHSGAVIDGVSRNKNYIGICFIGNGTPNAAQIECLARSVVWCEKKLGRWLKIEGHKDAPYPTSCPGNTWPMWKPKLLSRIVALR